MSTRGRGPARVATAAVALLAMAVMLPPATPALAAAPGATAAGRPAAPAVLRLVADPASGTSGLDVPLGAAAWSAPTARSGVAAASRRTTARRTTPYTMVGFTWDLAAGATEPRIRVRTHRAAGWSGWRAVPLLEDRPDAATGEGRPGLGATQPLWVGRSDGVQVDVVGERPAGLTMALIDGGDQPAAGLAGGGGVRFGRAAKGGSPKPAMYTRRQWGADPRLRSGTPTINRTIQQFHIHHTVNSNAYSRADVPSLIRGMYRYHTRNLGWSDLGYNFLVDRYGRTWVGRAGGAGRAVRGAHTLGFNDTSTGVAVIGNFELKAPKPAVVTALVRLAAWKLDPYGRRPDGTVSVYSHGSDRYGAGSMVRLPVIDGHRDTNETACPGTLLYAKIPVIRRRTAVRVERH